LKLTIIVQVKQLLILSKLIISIYQFYLNKNIITKSIRLSKRIVKLKEYGKAIITADKK
jgi:hypothetical protein